MRAVRPSTYLPSSLIWSGHSQITTVCFALLLHADLRSSASDVLVTGALVSQHYACQQQHCLGYCDLLILALSCIGDSTAMPRLESLQLLQSLRLVRISTISSPDD